MAWGAETGARDTSGAGVEGLLGTGVAASEGSTAFFSRVGGMSVVECLPVVHGGMFMNSSKVRKRGLQHFQPFWPSWNILHSLLYQHATSSLVSDMDFGGKYVRRARMVVTILFWISERLPAGLMYAFLCHCEMIVVNKQNEV